ISVRQRVRLPAGGRRPARGVQPAGPAGDCGGCGDGCCCDGCCCDGRCCDGCCCEGCCGDGCCGDGCCGDVCCGDGCCGDGCCSAIQARIARDGVITLPSLSLSAGSLVVPVSWRSCSREPLRRKGIGLPCAAITFSYSIPASRSARCTRRHGCMRGPPSSPWQTYNFGVSGMSVLPSSLHWRCRECTVRRRL